MSFWRKWGGKKLGNLDVLYDLLKFIVIWFLNNLRDCLKDGYIGYFFLYIVKIK